jgi:heptosyltransferase-1
VDKESRVKILIVKTSSMGDVIHAIPAASDIVRRFPGAEIHWLVEAPFSGIVEACPLVKKVHCCRVRGWRKKIFSPQTWREIAALRRTLRAEHFDLVIDLQGLIKSAVLAKFAGAPVAGYDSDSIREPAASCLYQKKYPVSREQSAISRCRALTAAALGFDAPDDEPRFVWRAPQEGDGCLQDTVIFFANTSRDTKLWPEEKWTALGRVLLAQNLNILLPWGSDAERSRAERLAKNLGKGAAVLPRKTVSELITLILRSKAVVGLDTGMTHLSAALNVPTVAIFRDYPIELVPLSGRGPKMALGGVNQCPEVEEVAAALKRVLNVDTKTDL